MNYLAHLALSDGNEEVLVGNFMADTVRRSQFKHFKTGLIKGIELHHFIDYYTDTHPVVKQSKKIFAPHQGKYSGVVVDIVYDHFLAKNFQRFYTMPLSTFAVAAYATLKEHWAYLSPGAQSILPYMIKGNWLENYATLQGMQHTFSGMSRRARFTNKMKEAPKNLQQNYNLLESQFLNFFPQLQEASRQKLQTLF